MPRKRLLLIAMLSAVAASAHAADKAWTLHDLDRVTDAATEASTSTKGNALRASMLVRLAQALVKAGDPARANNVLHAASALLDSSQDLTSTVARQEIVRNLASLGDDRAAEKFAAATLADADVKLSEKASLLGNLGAGRAQHGDFAGAQQSVQTIAALGSSNDPAFSISSAQAVRKIALALAEGGAIDEAIKIADGLDNKAAASIILARTGTMLCQAHNPDKGRNIVKRAMDDARANAIAVDKPFLMMEPIEDTAGAVAECNGVTAAAAFVREAIPPQTKEQTRSALIDQLAKFHQGAVALAVASPPEPGDLEGFLRWRVGWRMAEIALPQGMQSCRHGKLRLANAARSRFNTNWHLRA